MSDKEKKSGTEIEPSPSKKLMICAGCGRSVKVVVYIAMASDHFNWIRTQRCMNCLMKEFA